MFPLWLDALSWSSIALALICAVLVAIDVVRRPQPMKVMASVWPLSMLFGGMVWLAGYLRWGRARPSSSENRRPMAVSVAEGSNHCGAGCALGDLVGEWAAFLLPGVAIVFGAGWIFTDAMFAVWILDLVLAFGFGIVFQYFAIAPSRNLGLRDGVVAALKADAASITAWQIGMYGLMALFQLLLLPAVFGMRAPVDSPEFWFAMQLAMIAGFATSYPVNWLLIRTGLKERM